MESMVLDVVDPVLANLHKSRTADGQAMRGIQEGVDDGDPGKVFTVDPRTGQVPHQMVQVLARASATALLNAVVPPPHVSHGGRPAHTEVPVEIWQSIFKDLPQADLVNLSRVSRYIGAVSETILYQRATLAPLDVASWTAAVSRSVVYHRATAVRSLTISLEGLTGLCESANALLRLAGALSSLPDLRELTISGAKPHKDAVRDILPGITFSRLQRFVCDSDAIVLACWPALAVQSELEEFRGLYDYNGYIPFDLTPGVWPNLRILDAGASFVERITDGSKVTCLSVHVPRATATNILARITRKLGDQLITLRVVRTIICPHSGGSDWAPAGSDPYWESDSPVVLCAALRAPVLRLFELRDELPEEEEWSTDIDTLRERRAFGPDFRAAQRRERTPALKTIIWRPVWADAARLFPVIARDHVMDMFALLPVGGVAMPLVRSIRNTAGAEGEGWSFWERKERGEGMPRPPSWWEGAGTVARKDEYTELEVLWARKK